MMKIPWNSRSVPARNDPVKDDVPNGSSIGEGRIESTVGEQK